MRKLIPAAILLVALTGCKRETAAQPEAVRQAVIDHLGKRGDLNLNTMNIQVTDVEYQGNNEAIATVSFTPKGGEGGGMSMRYHLVREGDRWMVKGRSDSGGHGAGMPDPHGGATPPGAAGPADLPQGHPPVQPPPKK